MSRARIAYLFDVDNTLLDNDRVREDLADTIDRLVGRERGRRFWTFYEEVRSECDYVDFPHTLERFARAFPDERGYAAMADAILCYPYRTAAYPRAEEVLRRIASVAPVAILSDGDPVYQPAKIARAGLADLVAGRVFVFAHKEEHLDDVERRLPADRYVVIDDKSGILAAISSTLGPRVTTVHVRQGKYAAANGGDPARPADHTIDAIADLLDLDVHLGPEGS